MKFGLRIILALAIFAAPAYAERTSSWAERTTHQFFPTIVRALLGNQWALISTQPWFGDCSDGDFTISATTTLTRDMNYNNLTTSGGQLQTAGYRVFVCGTLDLSATGFINNPADTGGNGSNGGSAGAASSSGTIGTLNRGTGGTAGGAGSINTAGSASTVAAASNVVGTNSGAGGTGGTGSTSGGSGGGAGVATGILFEDFSSFQLPMMGDTTILSVSIGGSGGGGGSGNGTNTGGGGGGAGAGGGPVMVSAKIIKTSVSTSLGAIQSGGGIGGNGGSPTGTCSGSGCGGGGGGGGGSGGWVVVKYLKHIGPSVFLTYTGGGTGGTGGTGKGSGTNGANGTNGSSGLIYHLDLSTGTTTRFSGLGAI